MYVNIEGPGASHYPLWVGNRAESEGNQNLNLCQAGPHHILSVGITLFLQKVCSSCTSASSSKVTQSGALQPCCKAVLVQR